LALQRGGVAIDSPLEWWDSLSDESVEFWQAYWQVEPWGCEWERHSHTMSMLDVLYAATINPHLKKRDFVKPRAPIDFMPADYCQREEVKPNDLEAQLHIFSGGRW
jgi:hypothetical protein